MWGYPLVIVCLLAIATCAGEASNKSDISQINNSLQTQAGAMLIYRNAVARYAESNTGVTGSVPDSSLSTLPSWFSKPPTIMNYVSGGKGYVYVANPPGGLAGTIIARSSGMPINAGIKVSGLLQNPRSTTSTSLPAAIPDGSVVIAP